MSAPVFAGVLPEGSVDLVSIDRSVPAVSIAHACIVELFSLMR